MDLTEIQKGFLSKEFLDRGGNVSSTIGKRLLSGEKLIIAGNKNIYGDYICGFLKVKLIENAIDCLEYFFDIKGFLNSNLDLIKPRLKSHIEKLEINKKNLKKEIEDLNSKLKELEKEYEELSLLTK